MADKNFHGNTIREISQTQSINSGQKSTKEKKSSLLYPKMNMNKNDCVDTCRKFYIQKFEESIVGVVFTTD